MNIESYSEVIDLMVLECKKEERENVLTIMFTCKSRSLLANQCITTTLLLK